MENTTCIWVIWSISAALFLSVSAFGLIFGLAGALSITEKKRKRNAKLLIRYLFVVIPLLQLLSVIPALYVRQHASPGKAYLILFLPHMLFFVSSYTAMAVIHYKTKKHVK